MVLWLCLSRITTSQRRFDRMPWFYNRHDDFLLSPAYFRKRWSAPGGYREVLWLAGPLILSTGSWSIQHFVDRMFLTWYSPDAMAAALPAGMLSFTVVSFFIGTASYANTFVAQYYGARRFDRVGPSVWQAIYFALAAGLLILVLIPLAPAIFAWSGHDPALQEMERVYFQILCAGGFFIVYSNALSGFFTGRGKVVEVMWINLAGTAVNLTFDYLWIFGRCGFPEMGIAGAAWATVLASAFNAVAFTALFLLPTNRRAYATLRGWRFDRALFGRLMRYGVPSGVQFMLDMLGFTIFTFFVGRLGTLELGATNLAFQINTLAFLPMMGFGIAASTLVGQRLGQDNPDLAARSAWSAFHMTFVFMAAIAIAYVAVPQLFLDPFAARANPAEFAALSAMAIVLLRFVAAYCVFDTMNIIFAAALKGAGDTRFVMYTAVLLGWAVMVIPTWIIVRYRLGGIYLAWTFMTAYVILLALLFFARFQQGRWRSMRVIEKQPAFVPATPPTPDVPTPEAEIK